MGGVGGAHTNPSRGSLYAEFSLVSGSGGRI